MAIGFSLLGSTCTVIPPLMSSCLHKIGIWEAGNDVVGVVHYESVLGEAFFQFHPSHYYLKPAMLDYAEAHLHCQTEKAQKHLRAYVNDFDREFETLVSSRGYQLAQEYTRPVSSLVVPESIQRIRLPEGFRIKSLAEDNDLAKIHRVLWRGFNHSGEPPEDGIQERRKMQSGPNFRRDLTIVVEEPSGQFVTFCGMWYEPVNRIAYVEPLATDPDFRQMGLGKAAVWEGMRRCAALGATRVFVGSDQEFYRAIGFTKAHDTNCWARHLSDQSPTTHVARD